MANKQETTYWREQTNLIEQQFNEKNRQFFDDFRSYLLLSSLFTMSIKSQSRYTRLQWIY